MWRYIIRRLIMAIIVMVCTAIVIFLIMFLIPGDPAEILLGTGATPDMIEAKRTAMGLNRPLIIQLGEFLYNAFLKFDLGTSWFLGTPVTQGMLERIPRTLILGLSHVLFAAFVGVPMGIMAAMHRNSWMDRGLIVITLVLNAIPGFWLAMMLIIVFSVQLNWLPSYGIGGIQYYILPILSGIFVGFASTTRLSRASVLSVANSDYITTARAKGLKERVVIYKHILPNALIPILTMLGSELAHIIGGTVVTEKIFSFPGVGLYMSNAISSRDYPIVRGCVVIISIFTALLMLLVDISYAYVDPRIKAQYINASRKKGKVRVKRVK